ncbi:MAG: flagellar biosynthetic protein FliP, partial [Armatimonadota bacterium]|nr:flagellar biosynthetic protein FliP [Armatimonadota bacterium]
MKGKFLLPACFSLVLTLAFVQAAWAQGAFPLPRIDVEIRPADTPREASASLQILILLTVLTLAPAILILFTSFTRIVIVLALVRNALGVQQIPPNQVIVGLALFLTLFTMAPTLGKVNEISLQPYLRG